MPSVILLKQYQQHNGKIEFSRHNVILRDDYTCQYCKEKFPFKELTFDHVIPKREGGKTTWKNIVSACMNCNQEKGHSRIRPARMPTIPSYYDLAKNRRKRPITVPNESWKNYLGWNSEVHVDESLHETNVVIEDTSLPYLQL